MILINGGANAGEIAVINLEEVLKNSIAMGKVNKTLEAKKSEMEKKLKLDEKKLTDEKNTLESQIKTMSQEVAQNKVMDFQSKVVDFQKNVKDNENELQKSYMDSVMQVTESIKTIIEEMKAEKDSKYDFEVVLPKAATIYNDKNIDISSEVLSRLNKRLKEVKTTASSKK